jgi:hypothetical protein
MRSRLLAAVAVDDCHVNEELVYITMYNVLYSSYELSWVTNNINSDTGALSWSV